MPTSCVAFESASPSKGQQARRRLLEAALEHFARSGFEGASVRDIARAAGHNVAAIGYYFGGKKLLYRAVLEGIVGEIRHRLADVLEQLESLRRQESASPQQAQALLKLFLQSVYVRLLSRTEARPITRLIVLEQTQPTEGFDFLYDKGFGPLHEGLCWLVGTSLGRDPRQSEVILRTHTLLGQVYFFAMSREAILRRVGWRELGGKNAQLVARLVGENLDALFAGLKALSKRT